jgi:hypothetical protein
LKVGSKLTESEPFSVALTPAEQLKAERKSRGAAAAWSSRRAAPNAAAAMLPSGTASIRLAGSA